MRSGHDSPESAVTLAGIRNLEPDIAPLVAHLQRIGTLRLIRSVGDIPAIQSKRSAKWIRQMLHRSYCEATDLLQVAEYRNSADIRLAIELMETLYTCPGIEFIVVAAQDRDYIPL